jgi:hypothetical protein
LNGKNYTEEQWKIEVEKLRRNRKKENLRETVGNNGLDNQASTCDSKTVTENNGTESTMTMNLKSEGKKSLVRVAGRKARKLTKNGILALLAGREKNAKRRTALENTMAEVLNSREGEAIVGFLAGLLIPQLTRIPQLKGFEGGINVLAEELRIENMAEVSEVALDKIGELMPMLGGELLGMLNELNDSVSEETSEERVRVEGTKSARSEHETDEFSSGKTALKMAR